MMNRFNRTVSVIAMSGAVLAFASCNKPSDAPASDSAEPTVVQSALDKAAEAGKSVQDKAVEVGKAVEEKATEVAKDAQKGAVDMTAAAAGEVKEKAAALESAAKEKAAELEKAAKEKAAEVEAALPAAELKGLEGMTSKLTEAFAGNDQVKALAAGMMGSLVKQEYLDAAKALGSLSKMEFTKEQIPAYASLVQQVGPMVLSKVFPTSGADANPVVVKAVEYMKKGELTKVASQLTALSELKDLSSLQSGVIDSLSKSYGPILSNMMNKAPEVPAAE
ncbi:MAG: hypothetical protein BWY82_00159 [Verrucomicrobia bacterium ADurb.Bin474]|nr:MAG: hypothetical protein BWY82_00159 [Verrucomicrobia bacterium ADurb.Bin474]